jgi:hypothetical protein
VVLDRDTEKVLEKLLSINKCSISDIVVSAINSFGMDSQPCIIVPEDPLQSLRDMVSKSRWGTIENWCIAREINRRRLTYLMKGFLNGSKVWGFGNSKNKWRDKQDGRVFKTHTAYIAHCLNEDFGIDFT